MRFAVILASFGIIARRVGTASLIWSICCRVLTTDVPALAREALQSVFAELSALGLRIKAIEAVIMREHRSNAVSRRLATIPGIGPITASAITGTIADPLTFKSGRELAAWIGLVPRQHSSGGNRLRSLWCAAATSSAVMPRMSWRSIKI